MSRVDMLQLSLRMEAFLTTERNHLLTRARSDGEMSASAAIASMSSSEGILPANTYGNKSVVPIVTTEFSSDAVSAPSATSVTRANALRIFSSMLRTLTESWGRRK